MPESGVDGADHFVKQRRNIVIISLILIFYHVAGLNFKELNILGNKVTIVHPEIVSICLGLFFIYFLWRYFTACNSIRGID